MTDAWPSEIRLARDGCRLTVAFDDGETHALSAEYLRTQSPSAEVQGHAPEQRRTVAGKADVRILRAEPVGNYAVKLVFDDGHDSGLYTWDYLYELGTTHAEKWQSYLDRIAKLGLPYPTPVPKHRRV